MYLRRSAFQCLAAAYSGSRLLLLLLHLLTTSQQVLLWRVVQSQRATDIQTFHSLCCCTHRLGWQGVQGAGRAR